MADVNQYPYKNNSHDDHEPVAQGVDCADNVPDELQEPVDLDEQHEARAHVVAEGLSDMLARFRQELPNE